MVDRLEQPNGTKGTTEERPLDCSAVFNVNIVAKNFDLIWSL